MSETEDMTRQEAFNNLKKALSDFDRVVISRSVGKSYGHTKRLASWLYRVLWSGEAANE